MSQMCPDVPIHIWGNLGSSVAAFSSAVLVRYA